MAALESLRAIGSLGSLGTRVLSRIIELAEPGERDPIRLREGAVKGLLTSGALLHRRAGDDHPELQPERNNHHRQRFSPKGRRLPVPTSLQYPLERERELERRWNRLLQRTVACSRSAKSGVFERIFKVVASDPDNEYMMIDATIVRAHQHSAGARKKRRASDRPIARRIDHQDSCARRCSRQSGRADAHTGPGA